jgi:hypothetical protein
VASLQARSPLRSAHPLLFINKFVSLLAFTVLLGVGWIALSYLKSDVFERSRVDVSEAASTTKSATLPAGEANSSEAKPAAAMSRLVYSCSLDKDFYHAATDLPQHCERTALSEEAAIQRGLKRCKKCFPD